MTMQKQPAQKPFAGKQDENILVVKRTELFPEGGWHGLKKVDGKAWVERILDKKEFHPRSLMETDQTFKQIIPYIVFTCNNKVFLMQRKSKGSETRLQGKWTLGIGGHLREEDMTDANIMTWATREFHEEVDYKGNFTVEPLGILNDDSNDVGKVHAGFVYLIKGDSADITIKEEFQAGHLWSIEECEEKYESMETWAQIVFDWLKTNKW